MFSARLLSKSRNLNSPSGQTLKCHAIYSFHLVILVCVDFVIINLDIFAVRSVLASIKFLGLCCLGAIIVGTFGSDCIFL